MNSRIEQGKGNSCGKELCVRGTLQSTMLSLLPGVQYVLRSQQKEALLGLVIESESARAQNQQGKAHQCSLSLQTAG